MERVILTTPEELRSLIAEAINLSRKTDSKQDTTELPDTLSIEGAVSFLRENGFPTSKGKLYKLTSAKAIPFRKYGIKLVFSRKALLEWAMSSTIDFDDNEGVNAIVKHANRKSNR